MPLHTPLPSPEGPTPPGSIAYFVKSLGGATGLARLYAEAGRTLQLEGAGAIHHGPTALSSLASIRSTGPHTYARTAATLETWRRDRAAARRYFERARALDTMVDVPAMGSDTDDDDTVLGLRMPELPLSGSAPGSEPARRRRRSEKDKGDGDKENRKDKDRTLRHRDSQRKEKQREERERDETGSMYSTKSLVNTGPPDVDENWFIHLPGLLGAGALLLLVWLCWVW